MNKASISSISRGAPASASSRRPRNRHYAIGVDGDQDGLAPGNVLTSMVKRTDVAVENVVKDYAKGGKLGGKTLTFGLKEDGVGLSPMKYTKDLILPPISRRSSRPRPTSFPARSSLERRRPGYPDT